MFYLISKKSQRGRPFSLSLSMQGRRESSFPIIKSRAVFFRGSVINGGRSGLQKQWDNGRRGVTVFETWPLFFLFFKSWRQDVLIVVVISLIMLFDYKIYWWYRVDVRGHGDVGRENESSIVTSWMCSSWNWRENCSNCWRASRSRSLSDHYLNGTQVPLTMRPKMIWDRFSNFFLHPSFQAIKMVSRDWQLLS